MCVCVCVLYTCPSLWDSSGEMSGSFSRGSCVQEKKEKKKKGKLEYHVVIWGVLSICLLGIEMIIERFLKLRIAEPRHDIIF